MFARPFGLIADLEGGKRHWPRIVPRNHSMGFRSDEKEMVRQATDIVRLVEQDMRLTPKGREFVALCPFHDDSKPSMGVVPHKQIFHCFACGASGDVFTWMTRFRGLSFPEAVRQLAEAAGITLTDDQSGPVDTGRRDRREALRQVHEQALSLFRDQLAGPAGKKARIYLESRGMTAEVIQRFQIGFAEDGWETLPKAVTRKKWDRKAAQEAGSVKPRTDGSEFGFFRNRVMFPVIDPQGRTIAFGARRLNEEDNPKYLNSPEHMLFDKSATLYGIHAARQAMRQKRSVLVVEGYTDVIACHQAGVEHVVATLGTAMTAKHIQELRRHVDEAVLLFDGDTAGQGAAERAVGLFTKSQLDMRVCVLPDDLDPADFIEQRGVDQFVETIDAAEDAMAFQYRLVRERLGGSATVVGRQRVLEAYLDTMLDHGMQHRNPMYVAAIAPRLETLTGLPRAQIIELIQGRAEQRRATERRRETFRQAMPADSGAAGEASGQPRGQAPGQTAGDRTDAARRASSSPSSRDNSKFLSGGAGQSGESDANFRRTTENDAMADQVPADVPDYALEVDSPEFAPPEIDLTGLEPQSDGLPGPSGASSVRGSEGSRDDRAPIRPDASQFPRDSAFSSAGSRSKVGSWRRAQRQLIGCLVQDNSLFETSLPDGVGLDEALPPDALMDEPERDLYQRIVRQFEALRAVSLASLLSELAEAERQDLADLATRAEAEVEAIVGAQQDGQSNLRKRLICDAAEALRDAANQTQGRAELKSVLAGETDATSKAQALREALERRVLKARPGAVARRVKP